jgi:serine/threonine-protein kinase HipA
MRAFHVLLNETPVGILAEDDENRISFSFADTYTRLVNRPVLSQSFEDDLTRVYAAKRAGLPTFFANVIPEDENLRSLIENSLGVDSKDDLSLLASASQDLPGALRIKTFEGTAPELQPSLIEEPDSDTLSEPKFRFSLAGVQLKFSLLKEGDRLVIPTRGSGGSWIVKLPSSRYPDLTRNEYATLEWARACGFNVPEASLVERVELNENIAKHFAVDEPALIVKRFDRLGEVRIHQEDLAQVLSLMPKKKYEFTYDRCALLIYNICGPEDCLDFIKRVAFTVISGNTDAHLKNWSLLYADPTAARLSPMYDQVVICAYPDVPNEMALTLGGKRLPSEVSLNSFVNMGTKCGLNADETRKEVKALLLAALTVLKENKTHVQYPTAIRQALDQYWEKLPLVRELKT